jgi:hypothetical protein
VVTRAALAVDGDARVEGGRAAVVAGISAASVMRVAVLAAIAE